MRRLQALGAPFAAWLFCTAHVGSNQVVLEGRAGPYPIRVVVSPPGVVPAQVPIMVRALEAAPTRVTVRAAHWSLGTRSAPPAEEAVPVPGERHTWSHDLWIMTSSTYAIHVAVEGPLGSGTLVVPVQTSATRTLAMDRGMGTMLVVLGALLVTGLLTIVGAAARESSTPPGAMPAPSRRHVARVAVATSAGVIALALVGGAKWWQLEADAYRRSMLRPLAVTSRVHHAGTSRALDIAITDTLWRSNRLPPLMPDHGKMMHLFLVRVPGAAAEDAVAHLHPMRVQADTFATALPPLPPGRYFLFGDLLFQSGAQRTIVDTIVLGEGAESTSRGTVASASTASAARADADDSWRVLPATRLGDGAALPAGGTMTLSADGPVVVGRDIRLTVRVRDADGRDASLEPYMGMAGHAMVVRSDGTVFVHLHPMGTASMTAQAQLLRRERGDSTGFDSTDVGAMQELEAMHSAHGAPAAPSGAVSFPFVFPASGDYRVFVQVKRRGVVQTALFRVAATPRAGGE